MNKDKIINLIKKLECEYGELLGKENEEQRNMFVQLLIEKLSKLQDRHGELAVDYLLNHENKLSIYRLNKAIENTREKASVKFYSEENSFAKKINCANCNDTGLQRVLVWNNEVFYNYLEPCDLCDKGRERNRYYNKLSDKDNFTIVTRLPFEVKLSRNERILDFEYEKKKFLEKMKGGEVKC